MKLDRISLIVIPENELEANAILAIGRFSQPEPLVLGEVEYSLGLQAPNYEGVALCGLEIVPTAELLNLEAGVVVEGSWYLVPDGEGRFELHISLQPEDCEGVQIASGSPEAWTWWNRGLKEDAWRYICEHITLVNNS